MKKFNYKEYLKEGKLLREGNYSFGDEDFDNASEEEIINMILAYFKYERDDRPADMDDPDWWGGEPPFDNMSDEQIKEIIKKLIQHPNFNNPEIQGNYGEPQSLAWEIFNDEE